MVGRAPGRWRRHGAGTEGPARPQAVPPPDPNESHLEHRRLGWLVARSHGPSAPDRLRWAARSGTAAGSLRLGCVRPESAEVPRLASSLKRSTDSGRHRLVVALGDQAAQEHTPENLTSAVDDRIASCGRWSQLAAAVRTFPVAMHAILPDDRLQGALTYPQQPLETLPPTASDPALKLRVGLRRHGRRQDHSSPCRSKDVVSSRRKLLVSVMDDGLQLDPFLFQRPRPVGAKRPAKRAWWPGAYR